MKNGHRSNRAKIDQSSLDTFSVNLPQTALRRAEKWPLKAQNDRLSF